MTRCTLVAIVMVGFLAVAASAKAASMDNEVHARDIIDAASCGKLIVDQGSDVAITTPIPDLTEVSCCLWVKTQVTNIGTPFSYAISGQDNEYQLIDTRGLRVFVKNVQGTSAGQSAIVNDNTWHYVCTTWSSVGGEWEIYDNGVLVDYGSGLKSGTTIIGGGVLVLGQEQDSLRGGYDSNQALKGELAFFNMWNKVLSAGEISEAFGDCAGSTTEGNLFAWNSDDIDSAGTEQCAKADICPGTIKQDPHVMTFDGLKYNFNGYCSYTLVKSCDDVIYPPFEITADFRGRDPYHPYEPPTFMVAFNITSNGKQVIRINEDDLVLIKGKPMTSSSAVIGDDEGDVKLDNNRILVYLKEPALSLTWNRRIHGIEIGLNDIKLRGKVCGLLGNDDGNTHNEFIKPNGERTFNADEFGNSWLIPGSCP